MGFFKEHYSDVQYPIAEGDSPGLRQSQVGALHAISSHFTLNDKNCIVAMPTGTGKTAVLMMAAFILRAKRILIITPSRLVRYQIAEDLRDLRTLKNLGVLPTNIEGIKIKEQNKKLLSLELWNELDQFDAVVSTPNCCSPSLEEIATPPDELFDYVFIDEAHHSPSRTWTGAMDAFPNARKVLFTATPFRRDKKEIKGSIIYSYPLSRAFKDGSFGKIKYEPVNTIDATDTHIALRAQEILRADRQRGLRHALMVRTDSKTRAKELLKIYNERTNLKVNLIDSSLSYRTIKDSLGRLEKQELDGIICVDMLGEGYNFPNLKIAAIHAPHKSLEVTLQFIGRFSRTASGVDEAKFIAVPNDIELEAKRIYTEGAAWQEIITNLSENRIEEEIEKRRDIEGFASQLVSDESLKDVSLFSLKPYFHVKIFKTDGEFNLHKIPDLKEYGLKVLRKDVNEDLNTAVFITGEKMKPKWSTVAELENIDYNLFIVYYNAEAKLLFINSSLRAVKLYQDISFQFMSSSCKNLALHRVNKVLNGIEDFECFNIGMKNLLSANHDESYRIISGSKAHKSIKRSDGQLYGRGHLFAKGREDGEDTTIGLSSASKVWSNQYSGLSEFVRWCASLSTKIASATNPQTGTEIDFLKIPVEVNRLPAGRAIAANWNEEAFDDFLNVFDESTGQVVSLLDTEIEVDFENLNIDEIHFKITMDEVVLNYKFALTSEHYFSPVGNEYRNIKVGVSENSTIGMTEYLNAYPLSFYFQDFSHLQLNNLYSPPERSASNFNIDQIETIDWEASHVNIGSEFGTQRNGSINIHQYINDYYIPALNSEFAFYDHGNGEIADFIVINVKEDGIQFQLYHIKGTKGQKAGERVSDVYEVTGQVIRSVRWLNIDAIKGRLQSRSASRRDSVGFRSDHPSRITEIIADNPNKPIQFEIVLVQPGLSKSTITNNVANNLAAANDYCTSQFANLRILGTS